MPYTIPTSADVLANSATIGWKDNIAKFSAAKGNGTTEPVWSDVGNGNYQPKFTAGDELFVNYHVDHDYALGTKGYPHVHFFSDAVEAAGKVVTWAFEYTIAKGHSQNASCTGARTSLLIPYTYTGLELAGEHVVLECSDVQAFDLLEPDTVITAGVRLVSSTAVGNIFGIMADLHYQSNHDATLNKSPSFT